MRYPYPSLSLLLSLSFFYSFRLFPLCVLFPIRAYGFNRELFVALEPGLDVRSHQLAEGVLFLALAAFIS